MASNSRSRMKGKQEETKVSLRPGVNTDSPEKVWDVPLVKLITWQQQQREQLETEAPLDLRVVLRGKLQHLHIFLWFSVLCAEQNSHRIAYPFSNTWLFIAMLDATRKWLPHGQFFLRKNFLASQKRPLFIRKKILTWSRVRTTHQTLCRFSFQSQPYFLTEPSSNPRNPGGYFARSSLVSSRLIYSKISCRLGLSLFSTVNI